MSVFLAGGGSAGAGSPVLAGPPAAGAAPETPSAACSGTLTSSATETQVADGGRTLIITLTASEWIAAPGFDSVRQDIIDGLDSATSPAFGWNSQVRDELGVSAVVRTSDIVCTITFTEPDLYAINADETITVTVPDSAVTTNGAITATPTVTITNIASSCAVSGTLSGALEAAIVSGGNTTILTLTGDKWVAAGATFDTQRQNIIDGVTAATSPTNGWNNEVRDNEVVGSVVRTNDYTVTITWSAAASYDVTSSETITVTIPSSAVIAGTSPIVASPTVTVSASTGVLFYSDWSTATGTSENAVTDGGKWTNAAPVYHEVVSASGYFTAGFTNCLKFWSQIRDLGSHWGIRDTTATNVNYDPGTPVASEHRYVRWYFRYDIDDYPDLDWATGWSGNHPYEQGMPQGSILFKPGLEQSSTFVLRMQCRLPGGSFPIYTSGNLDKAAELRIEEHVEFLTVSGGGTSGTFNYDIRIYNAAGTLLYDSTDGDFSGMNGTTFAWDLGDNRQIQRFKLGQNSGADLKWTSGPQRDVEMWKYGGFCLRNDTWCGPYSGGI